MKKELMALLITTILNSVSGFEMENKIWQKVFVEEEYLPTNRGFAIHVEHLLKGGLGLRTAAAATASLLDFDATLFYKKENDVIMFTNHQVSPLYKNSSQGLACFTSMQEDLAFGAKVKLTFVYDNKFGSYLTDGINPRLGMKCPESGDGNSPWMVIDLRSEMEVKRIIITAGRWTVGLPLRMDVMYSTDLLTPTGFMDTVEFYPIYNDNPPDFSNFILLQKYDGTTSDRTKDIEFKADPPIQARYILFQKHRTIEQPWFQLQLCNLQVFG